MHRAVNALDKCFLATSALRPALSIRSLGRTRIEQSSKLSGRIFAGYFRENLVETRLCPINIEWTGVVGRWEKVSTRSRSFLSVTFVENVLGEHGSVKPGDSLRG